MAICQFRSFNDSLFNELRICKFKCEFLLLVAAEEWTSGRRKIALDIAAKIDVNEP